MIGIGIDIGSTAAKAAVVDGEGSVSWTCVQPTGFSSVDAAERLREALAAAGYDVAADDVRVIATGYGRVAVPYAHKVVTEITCHGTGAVRLFGDHGTVIDVGGQDTKVIQLKSGRVAKFAMNDKCVVERAALFGDHGRPPGHFPAADGRPGAFRRAHQDQQHVHGVCRKRGYQPDRSR